MNTKPICNQSGEAVAVVISGDYSVRGVYINLDVIRDEFDGDTETAFHVVKRMQNLRLLPRMGSLARPLTRRDMELCRRNIEKGKQHWQWIQKSGDEVHDSTGYDSVYGYGYYTKDGFIIVDADDNVMFEVN